MANSVLDLIALSVLSALSACSGPVSSAKAPNEARAAAASGGGADSVAEEPGAQRTTPSIPPVPSPYCAVRTPSGECFESKEQACTALGCPTDCSYLYGRSHDAAGTVACN